MYILYETIFFLLRARDRKTQFTLDFRVNQNFIVYPESLSNRLRKSEMIVLISYITSGSGSPLKSSEESLFQPTYLEQKEVS